MIKSYKITDTLFVNEQVIDMPKKEFKVETKHQYIILDRSGSMWNELDKIADVIINYVDTLTEGSTVSLGYFSGNGQYGLSVPYILKKEKESILNICHLWPRMSRMLRKWACTAPMEPSSTRYMESRNR